MNTVECIEEDGILEGYSLGVSKLAAAHRCPQSALDPAQAQGAAARAGARGVRSRVGTCVPGARWMREARLVRAEVFHVFYGVVVFGCGILRE
jgi:hypothetical protein